MSYFRQDLIEELIFAGGRSVLQYSGDRQWLDVWEDLLKLKAEGLVRCAPGEDPEEAEEEDEEDYENGPFSIHWFYCGGPISEALAGELPLHT